MVPRLIDDWLNNGPMQLGEVLPTGWRGRVEPLFRGEAIIFHTLGRLDLVRCKLFALADRGTDFGDCLALVPTADELAACLPWLELQDANAQWPSHVRATLADLGRRLGYGI